MSGLKPYHKLFAMLVLSIVSPSLSAIEDDIVSDPVVVIPAKNDLGFGARVLHRVAGPGDPGAMRHPIVFSGSIVENLTAFEQFGGALEFQERLENGRKRAIAFLDQVCELTPDQKRKLDLAGRGDARRFFDRIDVLRKNHGRSPTVTEQVASEVQRLQAKIHSGLLGYNSIFAKAVRSTLTDDQFAKLDEHHQSIRRLSIARVFKVMDDAVSLDESQREDLLRLMLKRISSSISFGNAESLIAYREKLIAMYEVSLMAETEIKPLLDPNQWQQFLPLLHEFGECRNDLIERKWVEADPDLVAPIRPAN